MDHLKKAAAALSKASGGRVEGVPADVSQNDDCKNLIEQTVAMFGGIDTLVNNAGASAAAALEDVMLMIAEMR